MTAISTDFRLSNCGMQIYTDKNVVLFQLRQGIARLQAAYRAQRLALQFNLLRERLVVLQGYCRGYVTRVKLGQRRKAVVIIQSGWRRVLAKKKTEMLRREVCASSIDLFHNDVKRGFQVDTRNLIGSAIREVLFKPIKFRLTSRFPRLTSL